MSVLKNKRNESKAEYVNIANQIFIETLQFMSRLSSRYSRLLAQNVINLAHDVLDNAEQANSIFPSDDTRVQLREVHLLEARASLMALDIKLSHCYNLMNSMDAYFKNYNDHNRILKLRRLFYSLYGFSSENIENFRKRENKNEIYIL